MQNILIKALIVISLFALSCEKKHKEVEPDNSFLFISKSNIHEAELNFKLYDSLFFQDIERKTNMDLCEESRLNGIINLHGKQIKTPLYLYGHNCEEKPFCSRGEIPCLVDLRNNYFIDDEISELANTTDIELIRQKCHDRNKRYNSVLFLFGWKKGTDSNIINQRFIEIYQGINLFYNDVALKLFNSELNNCSNKQKQQITTQNRVIVDIFPYEFMWEPKLPPPPISEEVNTK